MISEQGFPSAVTGVSCEQNLKISEIEISSCMFDSLNTTRLCSRNTWHIGCCSFPSCSTAAGNIGQRLRTSEYFQSLQQCTHRFTVSALRQKDQILTKASHHTSQETKLAMAQIDAITDDRAVENGASEKDMSHSKDQCPH